MSFNSFSVRLHSHLQTHRLRGVVTLLLLSVSMATFAQTEPEKNLKPLNHYDYTLWNSLPTKDLNLPSGDTLTVTNVESNTPQDKERVYIWIGNSYPPNDGTALLAQHLSQTGTVWYLDTPDAMFIPRTKTALRNLKGDFLASMLDLATQHYKQVVVISLESAAVPTLRGIREWQVTTDNKAKRNRLKNVVLMFPNLYVGVPVAGTERQLFPIASATALPITLILAERGALTNEVNKSLFALRSGGSLVHTVMLKDSTDGEFHFHNMRKMAKVTADAIMQGVAEQQKQTNKIGYHIAKLEPSEALKNPPVSSVVRGMKRFDPPIPMPSDIVLRDLDGNKIDVKKDYKGKALLINFWATWCPHCVEEIPSMNRALRQLDADHFAMVSVSYREPKSVVKPFTEKVAVDFPVLLDEKGEVASKWKVFAFPSSFLVDRNGMIRYSINAGNIWDTDEMLGYLRKIQDTKVASKTK
ncbi:MAG: TlpA family protein disulfide reductase [Thiotrichales bacterium]|nr:TlpA family protein disulfide reductase [Thiotrichales bacterium]